MANWEIEMGLGALGLSDQDKQTVEAAIPAMQVMVGLLNANKPMIAQFAALYVKAQPLVTQLAKNWATVGPALDIVMKAVAAKEAGTS